MGMSASQARLIALTARMNDIEYQGQQINQQRTTLAGQINALYNSLLDMSVPTPPSTQDYTKVKYTGTLNASSFTIDNITPKSDGTYNLKLGFEQSGNIVSRTTGAASIISTPTNFQTASLSANVKQEYFSDAHTNMPVKGAQIQNTDGLGSDYNIMVEISNSEAQKVLDSGKSVYVDAVGDDGTKLKEITKAEDLPSSGKIYITGNVADLSVENSVFHNKPAFEYKRDTWYSDKKSYTDAEINRIVGQNFLYRDGDGVRLLRASDFNSSFNLSNVLMQVSSGGDVKRNTESKTPYSLKNSDGSTKELYTLEEAKNNGTLAGSFYDAAVESLKHSFPEIDDVSKAFYVYVEDGEFKFIQTKDTTGLTNDKTKFAPVYAHTTGTYAETKEYENCQIEFDNDGRVHTIYLTMDDGNTYSVEMKAETVTDEEAYDNAFNEWEYKKYQYDQKQQEINLKTSIVQQQDKNLELKLTRLDNERNAVKTEIDAVKKVVQENIEKSYKTFSG